MKNTIGCVVVASCVLGSGAHAGWVEGFDAGIPTDWSASTDNPLVYWGLFTDFTDVGNYIDGHNTNPAAHVDSDRAGQGSGDYVANLVTHAWLVGSGEALSFDHNYQNIAGQDAAAVDITTDGGASWTNLALWESDVPNSSANRAVPGVHEIIDLGAFAGATARLRFRYDSRSNGGWNWYWQIDTVSVAPTPGVIVLVGVGGLVMTQRRRERNAFEPGADRMKGCHSTPHSSS